MARLMGSGRLQERAVTVAESGGSFLWCPLPIERAIGVPWKLACQSKRMADKSKY
jgi:hypothetical protein